jgi:dihydroxy-acid dehydratase
VFEAVGQHAPASSTTPEFSPSSNAPIPGPGSCGGMYTANTMASAIEALGMSLPNSSAQTPFRPKEEGRLPPRRRRRREMLKAGIRPLDILTKKGV